MSAALYSISALSSTGRAWITPLVLLALCVPGYLFLDAWALNRSLIDEERQWWLVLSGHFAHISLPHMLANQVGIVIAALVAPAWMNRAGGLFLAAYLVVGLGLAIYVAVPDVQRYVGFSGVAHGWLMVAFYLSPWLPVWLRIGVALAITAKIVFEHSLAFDIAQWHGFYNAAPVLTEAHLYGGILAMPAILLHLVGSHGDQP